MLFKKDDEIKIVGSCPVAKGSSGVMEFPPQLIAKMAGAVKDSIEWMVLLLGERSDDGYHVKVTDFRIPQQRRTSGDVSMTEPMEGPGSTIGDEVVGVLHSHHSMGPFFSGTDNTELNPFFKSSIVIAQGEKTALGFRYKAEGKVTLPCGSVGKIAFQLAITGSERWTAEPVRQRDPAATSMGDCNQMVSETEETDTEVIKRATVPAACGIEVNDSRTDKPSVFGVEGGQELLVAIRAKTTGYGFQNGHQQDNSPVFGNRGRYLQSTAIQGNEGHLSRKERKRLEKLSARRDGLTGSGMGDGDLYVNYQPGQTDYLDGLSQFEISKLPHRHAKATKVDNGQRCSMCHSFRQKFYLYTSIHNTWSDWLCAECYDWFCDELVNDDNVQQTDTTLPVVRAAGPSLSSHAFVKGTTHDHCLFSRMGVTCGALEDDDVHSEWKQGNGEGSEFAAKREQLGIAGLPKLEEVK